MVVFAGMAEVGEEVVGADEHHVDAHDRGDVVDRREMYSGVRAGTRTSAGTPASSAMTESWPVVSRENAECSRST